MKHPVQKTAVDEHGVLRFVDNKIVRYLLEAGPFDLNFIAVEFSDEEYREDHEQLAQLIGYSLCGFGDLSYVSDEAYAEAEAARTDIEDEVTEDDGLTCTTLEEWYLKANEFRELFGDISVMQDEERRDGLKKGFALSFIRSEFTSTLDRLKAMEVFESHMEEFLRRCELIDRIDRKEIK
jgi:hypothetical protein